ncbi:hypothetical protein TWF132_003150 [Orbilia oligospora]|nr:hypothetical protein TWF751_002715 [Orbilia oligospora]KAF3294672.1 hypothetical protein TWF132_003150 [Orbilia oligospora]
MSPPPLKNPASEEVDDKQTKPEPEGPNFTKIHGQVNPILHGARYVNGQIIEFRNVSSGTAQQVVSWYKHKLFDFQLYRLRLNCNYKHRIVQFKFSHPAGEALTEALRSKFTMWIWNSFRDIGGISRSISKDFQMLSYCPSPILSPVIPRTLLLTPALSIRPNQKNHDTEFPPLVIDYAFSPTNSPSELLRHWHDLYRSRDLWFSHSKAKTQVIILALFSPAATEKDTEEQGGEEEGEGEQAQVPRQNTLSINNSRNIRIQGRMDVWRYDKNWKTGRLTDEVILFPRPWDHQKEEEKITFKIQEIFGESFDFRFDESDIPEDMEFILDVKGLRKHMQENRNIMNLWAV